MPLGRTLERISVGWRELIRGLIGTRAFCVQQNLSHTHTQTPSEQIPRCIYLRACNQLRFSLLIAIPSQHQTSTTTLRWEPLAKSSITYTSDFQCSNLVEDCCWDGIVMMRVSCKKEGENISWLLCARLRLVLASLAAGVLPLTSTDASSLSWPGFHHQPPRMLNVP